MGKNTPFLIIKFVIFLSMFLLLSLRKEAWSDEIYLRNEDRISGKIIEEKEDRISVETEALGVISVKKKFIQKIVKSKEREKKEAKEIPRIWKKEVSVGYNTWRGNTKKENISLGIFINRNRKYIDEWTFKGNFLYSEANQRMDTQKWDSMLRYAFSINKAWYNFYRLEANHDKFANVYYRIIPSSGMGYWFFDLPQTKFLGEILLGWEYTNYYRERDNTSNLVAIPRIFYEGNIYPNTKFTQNLLVYPALTDAGSYRIHSDSSLTVSLSDTLGLRFSLVDNYNSSPSSNVKKNDMNFILSLVYSWKE